MKLATISFDIAALGLILGTATKVLPALAALLGVIWYGFVIYDRIRYGPEVGNRTFWRKMKGPSNEAIKAEL